MDTLLRKLDKALVRKGCHVIRDRKHFSIIRSRDNHVVSDMDMTGMTKREVRRTLEILLLAVTQ